MGAISRCWSGIADSSLANWIGVPTAMALLFSSGSMTDYADLPDSVNSDVKTERGYLEFRAAGRRILSSGEWIIRLKTKFGTVRLQCSPLDNRQECIPPSVRPNSDEEVIVTYFRYAGKGSDNVLIGREPFILLEMRTAGGRSILSREEAIAGLRESSALAEQNNSAFMMCLGLLFSIPVVLARQIVIWSRKRQKRSARPPS